LENSTRKQDEARTKEARTNQARTNHARTVGMHMYKHMLYFLVSAAVLLLVIPAQAVEQVLYNFCSLPNCQDGANPASDLVLDGSGNVWGTAQNGGHYGFGTIFELTASSGFTALGVVYSFRGGSDGANP